MFILFINYINKVIKHSSIWLFMDDLKIANKIINIQDCINLQDDLYNIYSWCIRNDMKLNTTKCAIMKFWRSIFFKFYQYEINSVAIERVDTIRDLGIIFHSKLNFNLHINKVVAKANKMWSFIWRNTKEFKNWKSIRVLYFSLVRSVLLYGSSICRPVCKNKIKMLEKVQHRAIRHLSYLSDQPMHIFSHDYSTLGKKFMIPTYSFCVES